MELYLAGEGGKQVPVETMEKNGEFREGMPQLCILDSIYHLKSWMVKYIKKKSWKFMLDSGAFTFMSAKKKDAMLGSVDWEGYVDEYAKFIVKNDIELFFELDIDVIVGLSRVEELRERLEDKTGRRCIPVWHKSRGLEYWRSLVSDYPYVAIGGIVTGEISRSEFRVLNSLCDIAHEKKTRVHGLGFTPLKTLHRYRFDSVDSATWIMGNRVGQIHRFNGKHIEKIDPPSGMQIKPAEVRTHNFREWDKYQRYLLHAGWRLEQ